MPPWTASGLFVAVLRTLRRQPLALLLVLGALPAVWGIPADLAYNHWAPNQAPAGGSGRPPIALPLAFAAVIWNSVWAAGCLRIGIDAARGAPVRFRHLVSGIAYTPLLVCTALPLVPLELLALFPPDDEPSVAGALAAVTTVLSIVLLARTALWAPFLVDARVSVWQGFTASWAATRTHTGHLLISAMLLLLPVLPLAWLELALVRHAYVAIGLANLLYTLAVGHLYVLATNAGQRSTVRAS